MSHRRLFEGDHARFFVGVVEGYEHGVLRACGHTWIRDGYQGLFRRKEDERTKIFALSSGTVIVYVLPSTTNLESLRFCNEAGDVFVRDDFGLCMDLGEHVLHATSPVHSYEGPEL